MRTEIELHLLTNWKKEDTNMTRIYRFTLPKEGRSNVHCRSGRLDMPDIDTSMNLSPLESDWIVGVNQVGEVEFAITNRTNLNMFVNGIVMASVFAISSKESVVDEGLTVLCEGDDVRDEYCFGAVCVIVISDHKDEKQKNK